MKNYLFIAIALFILSACGNQAELDKAKHQNDSLMSIINQRDSSVSNLLTAFNDVERNLDSVSAKQQIIAANADKTGGELKQNQKDRISAEIAAINNLMDENRKKIADLNHKLKGSNKKNAALEKAIAELNSRLTQKESELAALNEKLNTLNAQVTQLETSVGILTADNAAKAEEIETKTTALHTAYYTIGKASELQDAKIIDRKGGLLGIGRTSQLSSNFDNSKFERIDYTKMGTIPVNSKNVKIVTSHPSDSYSLERDDKNKDLVKSIIITNPEKFWSASKYLVVVKD